MSWSERVARELERCIEQELKDRSSDWVVLERITVTSPTSLEVVYRIRGEPNLRGIRVDERSVQQGPDLFQDRSPEDLGFYLAHTGVLEPCDLSSFLTPDTDAVAWMTPVTWMQDVARETSSED